MAKGEIVAAVDGSKASEKVADFAAELAAKLSARVSLVYVTPRLALPDEDVREYAEVEGLNPWYETYRRMGESVLGTLAKRVQRRGVECEQIHEEGDPSDQILQMATGRHALVLVLGLRGLHGIRKVAALGSVSRRVVENSPCPVVIVPS